MSDFNIFLTEEVKQQLRELEAREKAQASARVGNPVPMSVLAADGAMRVDGGRGEHDGSAKPCDGVIEVRAHMRGGFPVRAYTRPCPVHGYSATDSAVSNEALAPDVGLMPTVLLSGEALLLPLIDSVIRRANIGNKEELPQLKQDMASIRALLSGLKTMLGEGTRPRLAPGEMTSDEAAFYANRLIEATVDDIIAQEGFVPHPYVDTKGKETQGIGHLMETLDEFLKHPLYRIKNGVVMEEITDLEEKRKKFKEMREAAKFYRKKVLNPKTGAYEDGCTTPAWKQTKMQELGIGWDKKYARHILKKDMMTAVSKIRRQVAKHGIELFDLPLSQQRQLLDTQFNMGNNFLLSTQKRTKEHRSWPNWTRHFQNNSFLGMIDEIESRDIAARRNLLRQALLARAQLEDWHRAYFAYPLPAAGS